MYLSSPDRTRLAEAGTVLAKAFHDDPFFVYVFPRDEERAKVLPTLMTACATYGHLFGEVHATPGAIEGCAVWRRPGATTVTDSREVESGLVAAIDTFLADDRARLIDSGQHLDALHERDMPRPHWYLWLLGVDPSRQGQGVGSGLIQPTLARADAEGLPCYLVTMKTRNLPFYRRQGFEVTREGDLPRRGPCVWAMTRQPRESAAADVSAGRNG